MVSAAACEDIPAGRRELTLLLKMLSLRLELGLLLVYRRGLSLDRVSDDDDDDGRKEENMEGEEGADHHMLLT
jgi:hypothetical protein